METELSNIELIKKNIVERLMNNVDVLKYLEADEFLKNYKNPKIDKIYETIIFDYDNHSRFIGNNFITIDVAEYEKSIYCNVIKYVVSIRIGLEHHENLDKLASAIKDIISKLYPHKTEYSNTPCNSERYITFEIDKQRE